MSTLKPRRFESPSPYQIDQRLKALSLSTNPNDITRREHLMNLRRKQLVRLPSVQEIMKRLSL